MHIVMSILHATLVLVVAFFVWFAASKSDGWLRMLGRALGTWLIIVAMALLIFGAFGRKHHEHGWMGPATGENAAAASNAPANTTP